MLFRSHGLLSFTQLYGLYQNKYNYYFHNEGSSMLEIRLRDSVSHAVLKTYFVSVGDTISDSLNMTDKNSKFYFEFYGTTDYVFSGCVQ